GDREQGGDEFRPVPSSVRVGALRESVDATNPGDSSWRLTGVLASVTLVSLQPKCMFHLVKHTQLETGTPTAPTPELIPEQPAWTARAATSLRQVSHTLGLAVAVVVFGAIFTALNSNFGHLSNLGNIAAQSSILGIMATGMTFAIVAGEIDLSVGSVFA